MKTGLFFGSFNPIHIGHLVMASHMVQFTDLQQLWFVVSPQNPLKAKSALLDEYERLEMVRLATEDDSRLRASDIEFHLSQPSYTIHTLLHLQEKYPDREWVLIMGSDTLLTLPKWKNYEQLLSDYQIYVYPRPEYIPDMSTYPDTVRLIPDVPLMQISATYIRSVLKEGKSAKYLLPDKVFQHVEKWGLYKK